MAEEDCPYCNPQIPPCDQAEDEAKSTFGITQAEKKLIGDTWGIVKRDLNKAGVALFVIFFTDFPQYQHYFAFQHDTIEQLEKDPLLKLHGLRVMREINAIIENIEKPEVLLQALRTNALNHRKRNINRGAYDDLKTTILKLFLQSLGPQKFTPEASAAWDKALTTLFQVITDINDEKKCICLPQKTASTVDE